MKAGPWGDIVTVGIAADHSPPPNFKGQKVVGVEHRGNQARLLYELPDRDPLPDRLMWEDGVSLPRYIYVED